MDCLFDDESDDELNDADDGIGPEDWLDGGPGYDHGVGNSSDSCAAIDVEVGCVAC